MRIYTDSSIKEACYVIEGQEPVIIPYPAPVTCNVGEYLAVTYAVNEAIRLKANGADILTDSQLVARQYVGVYKCKNKELARLLYKLKQLVMLLPGGISVCWIHREENPAGIALERRK